MAAAMFFFVGRKLFWPAGLRRDPEALCPESLEQHYSWKCFTCYVLAINLGHRRAIDLENCKNSCIYTKIGRLCSSALGTSLSPPDQRHSAWTRTLGSHAQCSAPSASLRGARPQQQRLISAFCSNLCTRKQQIWFSRIGRFVSICELYSWQCHRVKIWSSKSEYQNLIRTGSSLKVRKCTWGFATWGFASILRAVSVFHQTPAQESQDRIFLCEPRVIWRTDDESLEPVLHIPSICHRLLLMRTRYGTLVCRVQVYQVPVCFTRRAGFIPSRLSGILLCFVLFFYTFFSPFCPLVHLPFWFIFFPPFCCSMIYYFSVFRLSSFPMLSGVAGVCTLCSSCPARCPWHCVLRSPAAAAL